jgi:membrane fusion protein, multidrug efflux system
MLAARHRRPVQAGLLTAALLLPGACARRPPLAAAPPPTFALASPETRTFQDEAVYQSTLEAIRNVSLSAEISGRIVAMPMQEGQTVRQGDLLFRLDQVQQQAQVNAAAAEARKDLVNAERYIFLNNQGAVSTKDRDFYVTQAIQSADKLRADQATLGYKNVLAPIAGQIGSLLRKQGDVVNQGEKIVNLIDNSQLWLRLDVPADLSSRMRLGLPVLLQSPDRSSTLATGSITFLGPAVDPQSQTLLAKATFDNPDGALRHNQRVSAILQFSSGGSLAIPEGAVFLQAGQSFVFRAVSAEVARKALGRPLQPEPPAGSLVALQVPVTVGVPQNGLYPVSQGLNPQDRVVLGNLAQLRSGMGIRTR